MKTITLKADKREILGKKVSTIRSKNLIPAIIYGKGFGSKVIQVDKKDFDKTYNEAGESALIDLQTDDSTLKVLISEVQDDPVTGAHIHIDFHKVNLTEEIDADVPLLYINEGIAPAVKELAGILVKEKDSIEVQCLPTEIPHEIEVDVSLLATFDDMIRVSDLKIPSNVKVLNDVEEVVALVKPPRSEEELEALDEEVIEDVEKVETVEEEEKEGEEAEEEVDEENKGEDKKE